MSLQLRSFFCKRIYFFFPSMLILNCFKHSARSCNCTEPQAGGRGTWQGSQAGLAAHDAAAEQCSQGSLTVGQHLQCCQQPKLCLHLGQTQRQHLVHRTPEEGGPAFTMQRWVLWSMSFPAGGLVLRAEGHHSCSSFCQRSSLCFFLLGPKHTLGESPVPIMVHCPLPCHIAISKAGTSLKPHELLALGFHSAIHWSQATK